MSENLPKSKLRDHENAREQERKTAIEAEKDPGTYEERRMDLRRMVAKVQATQRDNAGDGLGG